MSQLRIADRDGFISALDKTRNVFFDGGPNGLSGHGMDLLKAAQLLRDNREQPFLKDGLLHLVAWAPRFVLEQAPIYAAQPYAQEVVATATQAALADMREYTLKPEGGLPLELIPALDCLHQAGTLTAENMTTDIAATLRAYRAYTRGKINSPLTIPQVAMPFFDQAEAMATHVDRITMLTDSLNRASHPGR